MNSISLESFLSRLPFDSPDHYLEILRLAMEERQFQDTPEALTDIFGGGGGAKLRHPGLAAEQLWRSVDLHGGDFLMSPSDFTADAMENFGIRLFDPARWAESAGESLILPLHLASRRDEYGNYCRASITHYNASATSMRAREAGSSGAEAFYFRPVAELEMISQLAKMINFCRWKFLWISRRRTFAVTKDIQVNIFALKMAETSSFSNVFAGVLPPGSYDLNDEERFSLPEYDADAGEILAFAGYFDYSSGGGLRYLY